MKKTIISILTAVLAVSTLANTSTISAETKTISNNETKATVTFTVPEGRVDAINPNNPKQPVKPGDPAYIPVENEVTGNNGPLSLDVAPNLRFNEQETVEGDLVDIPFEITSENMAYKNQTDTPYLQVSDFRGTGTGWQVTAEAGPFKNGEGEHTLKGSTISFDNGNIVSPASLIAPVLKSNEITLTTNNGFQEIVKATGNEELNEAQGLGTWLMRWFDVEGNTADVILTVFGNTASPGKHTSEITWTLTDGPRTTESGTN